MIEFSYFRDLELARCPMHSSLSIFILDQDLDIFSAMDFQLMVGRVKKKTTFCQATNAAMDRENQPLVTDEPVEFEK